MTGGFPRKYEFKCEKYVAGEYALSPAGLSMVTMPCLRGNPPRSASLTLPLYERGLLHYVSEFVGIYRDDKGASEYRYN